MKHSQNSSFFFSWNSFASEQVVFGKRVKSFFQEKKTRKSSLEEKDICEGEERELKRGGGKKFLLLPLPLLLRRGWLGQLGFAF